jgi:hypothetical protein
MKTTKKDYQRLLLPLAVTCRSIEGPLDVVQVLMRQEEAGQEQKILKKK